MPELPALRPGDVLLYGGNGVVDRLIQFRTWADVAHVEVYIGGGYTWASRNGIGVGQYRFQASGLRKVLRPLGSPNWAAAREWFATVRGQPYAWGDLLRFYLINVDTKGMICSQFAAALFDRAWLALFSETYDPGDISPRDFEVTPRLNAVWTWASESTVKAGGQGQPA